MDDATTLDLCVPPQRKPGRDSFNYRPKAVQDWLANLPIANLGETSRALYDALTEVNSLRIKPVYRLEFLKLTAEKVNYVLQGLRKHYIAKEFPLPPKSRKVAELAIALLREVVTGYHIVIQAALTNEMKVGKKELAEAMHRAIRCSGQLLVEVYTLYQPSPQGVWRNLHGLYQSAEQRGLLKLEVDDAGLSSRKRSTISASYKQILLLACAGPYRMRPSEAADTFEVLERWAPRSELVPIAAAGEDVTFVVDLGSDRPPMPAGKSREGSELRGLVTQSLLQVIKEELSGERPWWRFWGEKAPSADPVLLRRMIISLGMIPKRQFSRQSIGSRAEVMVGLSHISRVLAAEHGITSKNELDDAGAHFEGRELSSEQKKSRQDVWELIYPDELMKRLAEQNKKKPDADKTAKPSAAGADTQQWRMLNTSAGGYCLLSDPTQSAKAQVGELIALRELKEGDNTPYWQLGVIRWLKHVPAEGLQLGVQVLAPNPIPVITRPAQDGEYGSPSRSLLLPEIITTDKPVTLITPTLHYAAQRKTLLDGGGSESEVFLVRELESTGLFSQFEFRSAAERSTDEEFDSVWKSI